MRRIPFALVVVTSLALSPSARAHEPDEPPDHPDMTAPVLIERVEPIYPEAARSAGVGGTVALQLDVAADGHVAGVRITRAAGFGLDEAAAAAARTFKFKPATHDGRPIAATVLFDQRFVIRPHLTAETSAEPAPSERSAVPAVAPEAPPVSYESTVVSRGPTTAASASTIRNQDFELRPKTSPNDILRVVPGLLAAQHQGGGKADQLFLRGFDADHGTDVGIFVDGVPINLPSHAHGQGFADLHWLIPEAISYIDVVKGPYDARYGDFSTGGAVNLVTRDQFDSSSVSLTVGGFPTRGCSGGIDHCKLVAQERVVAVAAPKLTGWAARLRPWVAAEVARDQGPFDTPQRLYRYNIFAKVSYEVTPRTVFGLFLSAYGSGWIGSGQIPSREVDGARLGHFGAIDPSEGGLTQRQMMTAYVRHKDAANELDATAYFTRYRLSLWNDFTFFLADPVLGDEIEQDDSRFYTGANLRYHRHGWWRGISFRTTMGAQLRYDGVHVDVWNAESQDGDFRQRLGRRADPSAFRFGSDDDIDVVNLAVFVEEDVVWRRWLRTIAGLRADYFGFDVDDHGERLGAGMATTSGVAQKTLLSPKATVVLTPGRALDLYLNFGMGYHSNDARIAVQNGRSPPGGLVTNIVPRIYGGELGARYSYRQWVSLAAAFWASYLENETVFDGDHGTFEPSDPTRRIGFDLEVRAQPLSWLYVDFDLAQASATSVPNAGNGGAVALAPKLYLTGGVTANWKGARGGLRFRYLGARPAFAERSDEYQALAASDPARVNTQAYVVVDLYGAYRYRWMEAGVSIQNLFDARWREAQFGNHSCVRDEVDDRANPNYAVCGASLPAGQRVGVADVHYTAGVPFNLQLTVKAYF
jgi:TonB family protein